jgi:hypothetical protein
LDGEFHLVQARQVHRLEKFHNPATLIRVGQPGHGGGFDRWSGHQYVFLTFIPPILQLQHSSLFLVSINDLLSEKKGLWSKILSAEGIPGIKE